MSQDYLQVSELTTGGEEADEEVKIGPGDGPPSKLSKATEVSQGQSTATEDDDVVPGGAQPSHIASAGGTADAEGSSSNPNPKTVGISDLRVRVFETVYQSAIWHLQLYKLCTK